MFSGRPSSYRLFARTILFVFFCLLACSLTAFGQGKKSKRPEKIFLTHPKLQHLTRGKSFDGDVRFLTAVGPEKMERTEGEEPFIERTAVVDDSGAVPTSDPGTG